MVNNTNIIWNYLDRNQDIKRHLARRILNIRSLAKYILNQNPNLNISITGAATAIRRYIDEHKFKEVCMPIDKIFGKCKLEMNSGNVIVHINKTENSLRSLAELFKKINMLKEIKLFLVMDKSSSFAFIFDNGTYKMVREHFCDDTILKEIKNIGEVMLRFDPTLEAPDMYGTIMHEIGMNDINIIDSITKREKIRIFVNEKDLMKTCRILYKFTKDAGKAKKSKQSKLVDDAKMLEPVLNVSI